MRRIAVILGLGLALTASSQLGVEAKGNTSSSGKIKLGQHWYGPKLSAKDLHGRVVLYEIWGLN